MGDSIEGICEVQDNKVELDSMIAPTKQILEGWW